MAKAATSNTTQPRREPWLDVARCLGCLSVLVIHCPSVESNGGLARAAIEYYAVACASVLFFMISGALVFYRPVEHARPWLKHRVGRVVIPMVIWTIVTLLVNLAAGRLLPDDFVHRLLMIPFQAQEGAFWFIYVVVGIYLAAPILAAWLARCKKHDLQLYLGIWFVSLFVPTLAYFVPEAARVTDGHYGYLYHFYGYLGLAVTGYYVRRYGMFNKSPWILAVLALVLVTLPVALRASSLPTRLWSPRLSPGVVALTIVVFASIKHIPSGHITSWATRLAAFTFGVYLTHKLVIMWILRPLVGQFHLPYSIELPLMVTLTALIAGSITALLKRLPHNRLVC